MQERVIGVVLLVIGAGLTYLCVLEPLAAAEQQAASVSVSMKGALVCPGLILFGFIYLALGGKATEAFGSREHPKPAATVAAVVSVLFGVGLYFWLRSALEAKGYHF